MNTECSEDRFSCKSLGRREVVARFDGGDITSDGGAILLRELEAKTGIIRRFAACFTDHRDPDRIEHTGGNSSREPYPSMGFSKYEHPSQRCASVWSVRFDW